MNLAETPVTLFLLIINVIVSLYALYADHSALDRLSFRPREILRHHEWHRMITAGFVHVGLGHLAFNMIALFFFGPVLEHILGPIRFLILYFGAELIAHAYPLWKFRDSANYAAVGASGAVSGVVFGFCLFFPFSNIYVFPIPFGIPAIIFAVLYVGISIYGAKQMGGGGAFANIGHEAHLGGAIGGLVLTILLEPVAIAYFLSNFTAG